MAWVGRVPPAVSLIGSCVPLSTSSIHARTGIVSIGSFLLERFFTKRILLNCNSHSTASCYLYTSQDDVLRTGWWLSTTRHRAAMMSQHRPGWWLSTTRHRAAMMSQHRPRHRRTSVAARFVLNEHIISSTFDNCIECNLAVTFL